MDYFNLALTTLFDMLLYPFRRVHPMGGLTVISVLTGIGMVWLFGKVSNQKKIHRVKTRIKAHLLEMWIFRDNLKVVFRAQGRTLLNTGRYALCSLRALAVIIIPVVLIMIQLQARYGYEPLKPGESTIVRIRYKDAVTLTAMDATLEASPAVVVETPALRIPETGELCYRASVIEPGVHKLTVASADMHVEKTICAGEGGRTMSSMRPGKWLDRLFHPIEPAMPAGLLESIEVGYDSRRISWLGMDFHWIWAFFILSIVAGFSLKRAFGVEV